MERMREPGSELGRAAASGSGSVRHPWPGVSSVQALERTGEEWIGTSRSMLAYFIRDSEMNLSFEMGQNDLPSPDLLSFYEKVFLHLSSWARRDSPGGLTGEKLGDSHLIYRIWISVLGLLTTKRPPRETCAERR